MAMMPWPGAGTHSSSGTSAEIREVNPNRLQPGGGKHEQIVLARIQFAQASIEIPAHVFKRGVWEPRAQLRDAPDAPGPDAPGQGSGSVFQASPEEGSRTISGRHHERIPRILALEHGAHLEAIGQHGRHVFAAVHREVDLAAQERVLDLLDEEALAPDFGERPLLQAIARRLDDHDVACDTAGRFEALGDEPRLKECELTSSASETKGCHWAGFFDDRPDPAVVSEPSSAASSLVRPNSRFSASL